MNCWIFQILSAFGILFLISCGEERKSATIYNEKEDLFKLEEYVGADSCAECHQESHQNWQDSHHFHAMELPNEKTVRADFNNTKFENFGVTTKFFRDGDKYLVETENQNGDMETFEIAYTFGWEPLQQYLVRFPDGRMQVLPTCWDVEKKNGTIFIQTKELLLKIHFLDSFHAELGSHVCRLSFYKPKEGIR